MKFRTFRQDKLWRDKAPKLMEDTGSIIHVKQLTDTQYDQQLRIKLLEEAQEVKSAQSKQELLEELADVFEVIDALCSLHNLSPEKIKTVQEKKRNERGGFMKRQFVTVAQHLEGSFGTNYCLASPEKYPEITDSIV